MLNILYCGLHYDYGNPERGLALEYKNMYGSLLHMPGTQASFFGIDDEMKALGRDGMNKHLVRVVEELKPDLVFFVLFTEELKKETVAAITKMTKTFNWFGDDHWRVPIFSRFWAPHFTLVGTTDSKAMEQYKSYRIRNVIKTQWAVNEHLYKPQDPALDKHEYDITFFGQNYGSRERYIQMIQKVGLPACGIGRGWPGGGGGSVEEMLRVYSFSKINLNFSETQYTTFKERLKLFAKFFVKKELGKYKPTFQFPISNFRSAFGTQRRTIKARVFEVPACGGFLFTGRSDEDISEYYIPGKEIAVFENNNDLIEKCRYYLSHDRERMAIAEAGYRRTLRDHTYEQRFKVISKVLGLV